MSNWNPVEGLEIVDHWTNMNDRDTVITHNRDDSYRKLTWSEVKDKNKSLFKEIYLLERAPAPEPNRLGAVVRFTLKMSKEVITIVRFRGNWESGSYVGGPWVVANIGNYETWDWDTVIKRALPGTIDVLSIGALERPPINPWNGEDDVPIPD